MINPAAAGSRRGYAGRDAGADGVADEEAADQAEQFDRHIRGMVDEALNVSTWTDGERMSDLEERLEREVRAATQYESEKTGRVLQLIEENIGDNPEASKESGIVPVTVDQISDTLRSVLFNGLVEACDGTRVSYDTLPISVIQIGLCMTTYLDDGAPTSVGHRLYRHDMVRRHDNAEEELLAFLKQRARASNPDENGEVAGISDMLVRAIMEHGERYLLTERSRKPWRMGHGLPYPYEMMTGSGSGKIIELSLGLLPKLLGDHKRFVFVPSETGDRAIRTIANALQPLQYAVLTNTKYIIDAYLRGSYRGKYADFKPMLFDFRDDIASKVLVGVYKASRFSPGHVFFAHEDHVHEAALIAMADSALQEHRGFPNLIDIADRLCKATFDPSGIAANVNAVFAAQGEPFRYLLERGTRA
ncbi:hypothetical protein [Bradyrhizobium diazoefficiens]|uniref:hypothetical protein n=1 Tax=Bradyrhizobium diazoefficiens TaxID=1355477 RepID=UPI002714F304|nr:hypothetical protein [Bradyrhizobium diazoefficiens]WLB38002.1 hypothetical protein QIH78_42825 [Bradyrhizobium diazoefficiens]WLC17113.1 hypothetical protein QIH76_01460 [Bradyrhizobium diazoefficiens]